MAGGGVGVGLIGGRGGSAGAEEEGEKGTGEKQEESFHRESPFYGRIFWGFDDVSNLGLSKRSLLL
jgi:hypothetical protein